ncbi:hypothetical protein ACOMHN_040465 [Nucella lapillus]
MVFKSQISMLPVTVKMAASCALSAWRLFPPFFSHGADVQVLSTRASQRCMAASARVRSEEEKKSRKAAREEVTAAHKQYPFLPMKTTTQVYVLDGGLADEIAGVIVKNQSDPSVPVLEANPGPGVLTRALLKAGAKRMVLAESTKGFMPYIQALQKEKRRHIAAVYHLDYMLAWRGIGEADNTSNEFESNLTTLFPHRCWEEGPPVSVVAMLPEQKERPFLNHLIHSHGRQNSLFTLGRPEWFLAVSPTLYSKLLVAKQENPPASFYYHLAIVLHLLFDIHLCAQLPAWKFTPRFPEKRVLVTRRNRPEVSNSMRYLLRLRPHVEQSLAPADVPVFHSFLAQLMQKKNTRLIPKMEQLVSGCGPRLIRLDITMMCLVADMSPAQFLTVFKAMQMWPEYQGSPLKQLLASSALLPAEVDGAEDAPKDVSKDILQSKQTVEKARQAQKDS